MTLKPITPPDGYTYLKVGDKLQEGDMWWSTREGRFLPTAWAHHVIESYETNTGYCRKST